MLTGIGKCVFRMCVCVRSQICKHVKNDMCNEICKYIGICACVDKSANAYIDIVFCSKSWK